MEEQLKHLLKQIPGEENAVIAGLLVIFEIALRWYKTEKPKSFFILGAKLLGLGSAILLKASSLLELFGKSGQRLKDDKAL